MKKYLINIFIIISSLILHSCNVDVTETIDKAVVQDKFYNPPGFQRPESFMLLVTVNTFGKYDKGDSINIIVQSEYINNKLKSKSFLLIE